MVCIVDAASMTGTDTSKCIAGKVKVELNMHEDPHRAFHMFKFFKAVPGGYGEGDIFIGVPVPMQRKIARKYYKDAAFSDLQELITAPVHEYRLTALIMLVHRFEKSDEEAAREQLVRFYLNNIAYINNWDLVDLSAPKILGRYLFDKDKELLYQLVKSTDLWKQRIAVMSTYHFIKNGDFEDTFKLARLLLDSKEDLIQKAIGWMLREIGKRSLNEEISFLKEHYKKMPRTMLRYAIERFDPSLREKFLKGLV